MACLISLKIHTSFERRLKTIFCDFWNDTTIAFDQNIDFDLKLTFFE